jgi:hypothetical protein
MKRLFLLICAAIICTNLFAPGFPCGYIVRAEAIYCDPMLNAFMQAESNFDTDTINRLGYGGILQIGQQMIDEANRICELTSNPRRFILSDRLDSLKSVQVWYIVQAWHNPKYDLRRAAKVWNPTASPKYLNKIERLI